MRLPDGLVLLIAVAALGWGVTLIWYRIVEPFARSLALWDDLAGDPKKPLDKKLLS